MLRTQRRYVWLKFVVTTGIGAILLGFVFFNEGKDELNLPRKVDYNYHIRPILSNNCYSCHGPDSSSREAGLRLDTYEGATQLSESGIQAIVPGSGHKSELIHRVRHEKDSERMPPAENGNPLSEREIALLEKWIDQGAEYKKHWSLIPPEAVNVPYIKQTSFVNNPIDQFILHKLEQQQLTPVPLANKETLIRRLSFVLTGLPPHPDHVQEFIQDTTEHAYEKWVDYYLGSSSFGERWARHWMDIVRYAETRGHEFDYGIGGAWHYRDYLIRAFNEDIPYDEFVYEHLAGDLLEDPRTHPQEGFNESVIGTAFFGMGEGKHSPVDIKEEESYRIDNMIDVTAKAFQGLTVGCAKCHDHKFDPIPTTDYYAMYGMLESMRTTQLPIGYASETEEKMAQLLEWKQVLRKEVAANWLDELEHIPFTKTHKVSVENDTPASSSQDSLGYKIFGDFRSGTFDGWYADGFAFGSSGTIGMPRMSKDSQYVRYLYPGKVSSRSIGTGIIGALRSPNFVIEHDSLQVYAAGKRATIRIVIDNFQLIQYPIYGGLSRSVDTNEVQIYGFRMDKWKGHKAYIEMLPGEFDRHVYSIEPEDYIDAYYVVAFNDSILPEGYVMPEHLPTLRNNNKNTLKEAIENWSNMNAHAADVAEINRAIQDRTLSRKLSPESRALLRHMDSLEHEIFSPAYIEGVTTGEKVYSPVFHRGNHNTPLEDDVPHRFLTAIAGDSVSFPTHVNSRMAWTNALFESNNPLTSRVMVNRLWHHVFGRGIVETVDNFGVQGKLPSHPELLDYLAEEFVKRDWSMKSMIKVMVMSQTFQRQSQASDEALQKDPQNILLSHYSVRRLEAEAIRDAMLATSGCMDSVMYGASVPVHLTEFMNGRGRPWYSGPLDGAGRRSIYTSIRRNFLPAFMQTFDMPVPATTFGNRNVTNIPAQSLALMNDPFVIEQSYEWAKRLLKQYPASWERRVNRMYWEAFSRAATQDEIDSAGAFLEAQGILYDQCEGEWLHDHRTWQDLCHAMFNVKSFIYTL